MNTKVGASEYETILRMRLARGEPVEAAPAQPTETFAAFAKNWLETYVATNNKHSERESKRLVLGRHLLPTLGHMSLEDIGPQEIESYKAAKLAEKLNPKTINNHLAILGKCLRTAEEWGRLARAPQLRLLRAPQPKFDFLLPDESARLLSDQSEPCWDAMALVALRTGLRRGELLALEPTDADLERRILTVRRSIVNGVIDTPKSNRIRHIPLTNEVHDFFVRAPRSGFVFGRDDGRPHSADAAENGMRRLCLRVGLRSIGWHTLRHTFASDLVAAGVPLLAIQQLLGHASITMTMRYAHLAPSALRGAVDALEQHVLARTLPQFGQPAGNAPLPAPLSQAS